MSRRCSITIARTLTAPENSARAESQGFAKRLEKHALRNPRKTGHAGLYHHIRRRSRFVGMMGSDIPVRGGAAGNAPIRVRRRTEPGVDDEFAKRRVENEHKKAADWDVNRIRRLN